MKDKHAWFWYIIATGVVGAMGLIMGCQQDDLAATVDMRPTSNVLSADRAGQVDLDDLDAGSPIAAAGAVAGAQAEQIVALTGGRYQYRYPVPVQVSQLDMVWMIDNSGSMKDNIEGVLKNMTSFTQWLDDKREEAGVDVRAFLISCNAKITSSVSGHGPDARYCIDFDGMEALQLTPIHHNWAKDHSLFMPQHLQQMAVDTNHDLGRSLASRPQAKKIFMIVTDEAAHPLYESEIKPVITAFDKVFGRKNVAFFSFSPPRTTNIGHLLPDRDTNKPYKTAAIQRNWLALTDQYFSSQLDELTIRPFYLHKMPGCSEPMTYSWVYEYLAMYYQGKLYNICDQGGGGWQFDELQGDITASLKPALTLIDLEDKTNVTLHDVAIDGVSLAADEYTMSTDQPPILTLHTSRSASTVVITVSHDP